MEIESRCRTPKTQVRLIRLADLVWYIEGRRYHNMDVRRIRAYDHGICVWYAQDACWRITWTEIAEKIGLDKCELVLDPDGSKYVLVYNEGESDG